MSPNTIPESGSSIVTSVLAGHQNTPKFSHLLGTPRSETSHLQSTSTPSSKYSQFAKGERINQDCGIAGLSAELSKDSRAIIMTVHVNEKSFKILRLKAYKAFYFKNIGLFFFQPDMTLASISPQKTWFLYQMVTQNMLRTHEGKLEFSEKKYPICGHSRSSQMP